MTIKLFTALGVALVAIGITALQFSWWLSWYCDIEYAHEIGCILIYVGGALLLSALILVARRIAEAIEKISQLMAMKMLSR